MAKALFSPKTEMAVIRTLTAPRIPEKARASFLGMCRAEMFNTPVCKLAYKRIAKITERTQVVPSWDDLVDDPSFDSEVREELSLAESKFKPLPSKTEVKSALKRLDRYRQLRELYECLEEQVSYFDKRQALDPEELANLIADRLTHVRKNHTTEQKIWNIGVKSNAKDILKQALYKPSEKQLVSGFTEYDTRNGGLPASGVMLLAGTTSGGKSVIANNLLKNVAELNKGVRGIKITLEMTAEQEANRIMSMVTGVPFWRIKQKKLTPAEKLSILRKMKAFNKKLKANKSQFGWVSPEGSMSIDDVLNMCKPYGYNLIILDYISLLEGVDDDNQWRMLSAIARKAKVFATETKCLFVILCQLDGKTNQLRYSQGVKEHADVMWAWNYTDEAQRALKILPVKVVKARDGELFDLDLLDRFEVMQVGNPDQGQNSGKMKDRVRSSQKEEDNGEYIMS